MPLGKVLVTAGSVAGSAAALRAMRDAGCELLVQNSPSPFDQEWLLTQVRDVDGLIVAMEPLTRRVLDAAPRLRVIARPGVVAMSAAQSIVAVLKGERPAGLVNPEAYAHPNE